MAKNTSRRSFRCEHGFEVSLVPCVLCARQPMPVMVLECDELDGVVCAFCEGEHVAKYCNHNPVGRRRISRDGGRYSELVKA